MLKADENFTSKRYQQQLIFVSNAIEHERPFIGIRTRDVILALNNAESQMVKGT